MHNRLKQIVSAGVPHYNLRSDDTRYFSIERDQLQSTPPIDQPRKTRRFNAAAPAAPVPEDPPRKRTTRSTTRAPSKTPKSVPTVKTAPTRRGRPPNANHTPIQINPAVSYVPYEQLPGNINPRAFLVSPYFLFLRHSLTDLTCCF